MKLSFLASSRMPSCFLYLRSALTHCVSFKPILQGVSSTFSNVYVTHSFLTCFRTQCHGVPHVSMSISMVSRLIINIQNPRLFSAIVTGSRTLHSSSTASNAAHIGPFVTTVVSHTELSADQLDSQFSMDMDLPWVGVPARGRGRAGRRLWYDLDPAWAGMSQRDVNEEATEVSRRWDLSFAYLPARH